MWKGWIAAAMIRTPAVTVGQRFTRVGQPNKIYVVADIRQLAGCPRHARLRLEDASDEILIALTALTDSNLYRRVQP